MSILASLLLLATVGGEPDRLSEAQLVRSVDRLIQKNLDAKGLKPNPDISDEVFVRRAYLDIAGRTPTLAEYRVFIKSKDADKRNRLIDTLITSPGHVSHSFNYWADALRATSWIKKANGKSYLLWIKTSIAKNQPYDAFVRDLVRAEGPLFEPGNGSAGYYLRDFQMPLDNVANTLQLFLGTSMVCAQCHDHPYNDWSQMDFYKLAAFTDGTMTNAKSNDKATMRGVKKPGATTVTSAVRGIMETNPATRAEGMALLFNTRR